MKNLGQVAIIGAGWVAGEYIKAFAQDGRTEVVGVYNRTRERAQTLMDSYGLGGTAYSSLDELLDDERIGIVVSCTTPDVRPRHVCEAARSGRHVVIEKPVALTSLEVDEMRQAISDAGVRSVTSFVSRWNPQVVTTKQMIADGLLGELIYAEADYWHPVPQSSAQSDAWKFGLMFHNTAVVQSGCHAVDVLRYLGGEIVEVSARSARGRRNTDFAFDPTVVASLTFANGAVGKVSTLLDGDMPYEFNVRMFGDNGSIQDNRIFSSSRFPGARGYFSYPTTRPDSFDVSDHSFGAQIAHFVDCIESDEESHASIHDTWKTMSVCFAVDESLANGGLPTRVALD